MRNCSFVLCVALCIATSLVVQTEAADPATKLATKPAEVEQDLTEAQQSILLQLSDAEANIRALNLALKRTGYKVGQAYDRIEGNQKGSELMDRKGGGPVGWQD